MPAPLLFVHSSYGQGNDKEDTMKNVLKLQKLAVKSASKEAPVAVSCTSCDSQSCNKQAN